MDDLISRADALEALKDMSVAYDAESVQRCIETVSNLPSIVDALPTVENAPQWTPATDRMPEPFKAVLVYTLSDDGDHCFMTTASHDCGKYWYDECFYQRLNDVYAWMPLPKPYEVSK